MRDPYGSLSEQEEKNTEYRGPINNREETKFYVHYLIYIGLVIDVVPGARDSKNSSNSV